MIEFNVGQPMITVAAIWVLKGEEASVPGEIAMADDRDHSSFPDIWMLRFVT